ncbi:MAG: DUF1467 family protein [Pseudomonadota bacterium]
MAFTSMCVVYAVTWFMTLFVVLPLGNQSQGDVGEVEVGTPASAPSGFVMRRKFRLTTLFATLIAVPIICTIHFGWITVDQIDLFKRFGPES